MTALTLIALNPRSRTCRTALADPQTLHRTIMAMYPNTVDGAARQEFGVLWRVERGETPTLLVQSHIFPDPGRLPDGFATNVQVRSLDTHLDSLRPNGVIHYRVALNPVRTSRRTHAPAPRSVVPFAERATWWAAKASRAGLELLDPPTITTEPARTIRRNGQIFPIYTIRADGTARILDTDTLRETIRAGIGHGKAWGCGLLTVISATRNPYSD